MSGRARGFPTGKCDLTQAPFASFDQTMLVSRIWVATPRDASALVQLANWAVACDLSAAASRGHRHSFRTSKRAHRRSCCWT